MSDHIVEGNIHKHIFAFCFQEVGISKTKFIIGRKCIKQQKTRRVATDGGYNLGQKIVVGLKIQVKQCIRAQFLFKDHALSSKQGVLKTFDVSHNHCGSTITETLDSFNMLSLSALGDLLNIESLRSGIDKSSHNDSQSINHDMAL